MQAPRLPWCWSPQLLAEAEAPPHIQALGAGFARNPLQRVPGSLSKPQRKQHSLQPNSGGGGSPAIMGSSSPTVPLQIWEPTFKFALPQPQTTSL